MLKKLTTDILEQVNVNIYLDEDNKKLLCELDLLKAQIKMYMKQNKGHMTQIESLQNMKNKMAEDIMQR